MPIVLPDDAIDEWLTTDVYSEEEKKKVLAFVKPYSEKELKAHTVNRLRGKNAVGNIPEADKKFRYSDLADPLEEKKPDNDLTLF